MDSLPLRTHLEVRASFTASRISTLILAALVASPLVMAEPLTEERSLALGLSQPHFTAVLDNRTMVSEGELLTTRTWANPEFEFLREKAGDETETGLWLRQPLDLSGRRALNREAAEAEVSATLAGNDSLRLQRSVTIREQFYQALFQQQQQQTFARWVEKFTQVEAAMRKREEAGDVSGYDRLRISREKISLLSQQRHSQAGYEASWRQLLGLIDAAEGHTFDGVEGKLIPDDLPPLAEVEAKLYEQPTLRQLQHQGTAAQLSARAASRGQIPEITLGVGRRTIDAPGGSDSGLMVSAAIPLPLFDRRQGERQRSTATARELENSYQLLLGQSTAEAQALWNRTAQLAENARLFKQESLGASDELLRIAELSYHNNEVGVVELIDAYRSALEAELTAQRLALEARLSRIQLDKITEGVSK